MIVFLVFLSLFSANFAFECGIPKEGDSPHPWLVRFAYDYTETRKESKFLIRKVITEKKRIVCGGVILDESHIITTGGCGPVHGASNEMYTLYVGSNPVKQINIGKPEFHSKVFNMIMRLDRPLEFCEDVKPICLSNKNYEPEIGSVLKIAGWETDEEQRRILIESVPKFMKFTFGASRTRCRDGNVVVHKPGGVGCSGFEGGPMMYENEGKWFLYASTFRIGKCNEKRRVSTTATEVEDHRQMIQHLTKACFIL
ncbi:putative serine protease 45 [Brevipalpus obovatus]|uniref:putative serine protease 45 n=1 Tax=Brevipalpus obovatus TaxID=246614 RepID=UPI003D9EB140